MSRKLDEDTYEFSGRVEIEKINETYHIDLPEDDDYQTLAGLLLHHLGAIPAEGEVVEMDGFKFTVLKKVGPRLELIKVNVVGEK